MRARLLLYVSIGFGLACAGVDAPPEAEAPPEVAPAPAPAEDPGVLAFDVLYASEQNDDSRKYFRFYEDGHVSQVGSTGAPDKVANWLGRSHQHSGQGTYTLDGSTITFATTTEAGTVDYRGTLREGVLQLTWSSQINGATGEVTASPVPVSFGAE